jgi:predicted aminopeptidase
MKRVLLLILIFPMISACYYVQAAKGQMEVMRKREPLNEVIENPDTSPELAARLRLLDEARDYSISELGLPDNNSYRTYTELERDYVVWNVFAAPEFSLTPKQWCFPVAGCVSYRGYFSKDKAIKESQRLAEDGFDVAVGGVAAYSTLGNFADPILSTMMHWDDVHLVAVLFHELAHQVVYVKDDSEFNESFATAVEEFGVKRWLQAREQASLFADYVARRDYQQRLADIVAAARTELETIYSSDTPAEMKRELKSKRLSTLVEDVTAEAERSGLESSGWLKDGLNNAHLISTTLYEGRLPSFRALFRRCENDINCFYAESRKLARLDFDEREVALSAGDLLRFGGSLDEQ